MDWQAIGAVGEILGAIAVVVSVVYPAVQVRDRTRSTRALLLQGLHSAGAGCRLRPRTLCAHGRQTRGLPGSR